MVEMGSRVFQMFTRTDGNIENSKINRQLKCDRNNKLFIFITGRYLRYTKILEYEVNSNILE